MPARRGSRERGEVRTGPGCAVGLAVLVLFLGGCGLVLGSAFASFPDLGDGLSGLGCVGADLAGDPNLSRIARAPDGQPARWTTRLAAVPSSPPVVVDGRVVVRTRAGAVVALDAATGATVWTVALGPPSPLGTDFAPAVAGDTLYLTDWDGVVHALDAATGAIRWSTPLPVDPATTATTAFPARPGPDATSVLDRAPRGGAPVTVDEDAVYVDGTALVALDRATGTPRWSSSLANTITGGYSQPVRSGDLVLVGAASERGRFVRAVDRADGATRWESTGDDGASIDQGFAAPRLTDVAAGVVVTGLRSGAVVVLDRASGHELRRVPIGGAPATFGSVAERAGALTVVRARRVTAFDASTGAVAWTADVGGAAGFDFAPPLVTDGTVVTPGGDGRLHALDVADGHELWATGAPRTDRCNQVSRSAPPASSGTATITLSAHRSVVALPLATGT